MEGSSASASACAPTSASAQVKKDTKKMQSKVDGRCISISTRCSWLVPPPSSDRLYAEILAAKNVILSLFCGFCSRNCCWWWCWGLCCSHIKQHSIHRWKFKYLVSHGLLTSPATSCCLPGHFFVVINNLIILNLKNWNWICVSNAFASKRALLTLG